jgi:hypothetical protein
MTSTTPTPQFATQAGGRPEGDVPAALESRKAGMASTWRVTVRVLSVKGKHVDYHFQVDKQPLPAG